MQLMYQIGYFMKSVFIAIYLVIYSFLPFTAFAADKNTIYIYSDEGVSSESLMQTISTFNSLLKKYVVKTINAIQVKNSNWYENAILFVMPGGADLPYAKALNGEGNSSIKRYVKNGGAFLGICAGSYYSSSYVEFDKDGPLEVVGGRELSFFEGKAIGPIFAPYDYTTQSSSKAAKIHIIENSLPDTTVFYNGGGFFENAEKYPNTSIVGTYDNDLPAIILIHYGKGKVLLSGVHFEYDPALLNQNDEYIKKIIDPLRKANNTRKILFNQLMKAIGIS